MARISGLSGDDHTPVFVISVAADLAGMHAQTLRQYDRIGLVTPSRTRGGGRRYSAADVTRLREVQRLSQEEGVSLAGVERIMRLELQLDALRSRVAELTALNEELGRTVRSSRRVFAAGAAGEVTVLAPGRRPRQIAPSTAVVLWRPQEGQVRR